MTTELSDSTALVTGATAGIGRAVALQLAAEGAEVVVHGRDAARGEAVVREIVEAGGRARFVAADLTAPADVERLAREAGAVDVLINNAGIYEFADTPGTTVEQLDAHHAINVRAPFLLVAALAPGMAERGHGSIVNVSTVVSTTPARGAGIYGATKAALNQLTRVWADEFGGSGVRVNGVSPGPVRTPGTAFMGEGLDALGATTIAGRVADPTEIAEAIVFVASSRASYINGTTLDVDGGHLAIAPN